MFAKLELALKRAKGPCDECEARQTEIKSLQDNEKQMNDCVCSLEHLLENEKQARKQLEKYKDSLEQSLNSDAVEMRTQVIEFYLLRILLHFLIVCQEKFILASVYRIEK